MLGRNGKLGLVLLLVASCSSNDEAANVHYEVKLRDGGAVEVSIRYSLPSGDERTAEGTTPWTTPEFAFDPDAVLSIRAETTSAVESPLLCNLVGRGDEGSWTHRTIGEPLDKCVTEYPLGQWPPDDSNATYGALIRVG
jgi:hypothetical protein